MKFYIGFEGYNPWTDLAEYCWQPTRDGENPRCVGLDFLDRVRKELGVPNLPPDRVVGEIGYNQIIYIEVEITEAQAREIGLFSRSCRVRVYVPAYFLNRYARIEYDVKKSPTTGEIIKVYPKYVPDLKRIVEAWIAAGKPRMWGYEDASAFGAFFKRMGMDGD